VLVEKIASPSLDVTHRSRAIVDTVTQLLNSQPRVV
jgi:hypothetical protein